MFSITVSKMGMTELALFSLEWKLMASITTMSYSLSVDAASNQACC